MDSKSHLAIPYLSKTILQKVFIAQINEYIECVIKCDYIC